jgi:hypothetical protein
MTMRRWPLALLGLAGLAYGAPPRVVTASSEAVGEGGVKHQAANAFDGLLSTGWAEGELGDGKGAWLEIRFDKPTDIASLSIFPGWLGGSDREIREYGRPKLLTLSIEVASGEPVVKQERLLDPGEEGPLRHDVIIEAKQAKAVRFSFDEVFSGGLYSDTFLAEVAVNLVAGAPPSAVADVSTWLQSEAGQKAADTHRTQAIAVYDAIKSAEFGDKDGFQKLMDWASDGAPYLRAKVATVPPGFRLHALQPDKTAIEGLLKLKDSNAIPAIERASLRVTGALAEDLKRRARLFDAYQELLGGGNRNVVPWGQEGIGKGALRSRGAPLDIAVDTYGGVYVADVGNHRVQRFGIETGVVDQVWGSKEAAVSEKWFERLGQAYASGAAPGLEPGQFVNPTDLDVIVGSDGDRVLVLDGAGRVSLIDPAGQISHVQKVGGDEVGIGPGEGHVLHTKGKVVVILGNEGFVYDLKDWTEQGTFKIEDGVPSSAVAFKNGKLGLVFGSKLIQYSLDGFRFGDMLGDSLGQGYEDWAVTLDERGKLWAVLDTGRVVKFKKPGKVDYAVTIGDYSLQGPRLAVFADHVFVTERDHILHADALDLLAKEQAGVPGEGTLAIPDAE